MPTRSAPTSIRSRCAEATATDEYLYVDDVDGAARPGADEHARVPSVGRARGRHRASRSPGLRPRPGRGHRAGASVKAGRARHARPPGRNSDLRSWVRLSGGKGLHVVVPVRAEADWDEVKAFCEAFADAMVAHAPAALRRHGVARRSAKAASSSTGCATRAAPPASPAGRCARAPARRCACR